MSAVNSTGSTDTSRITGMFSDLDTDAIVKNMCSTQQSRIDRQEQKKTTYEWYSEAVSTVADKVKEFQNTYCSVLGTSSMLQSATYYSYSVESSSTSKAVSLSTSNSALTGDYAVKVLQLAKNTSTTSSGTVSLNGDQISSSNSAKLSELSLKNGLEFDKNGNISFSINGETFSFSKDTTLQNMISTINNNSEANVTMKYSRLTDAFTITADSGGEDSSVSIQNFSGNAFGEDSAFMIGECTNLKNGCNSIAEINGVTVTRNSNDYTIDGVTFELNAVTKDTAEETIEFTVERDYSATTDAISSFVDAFNDLITTLTTLTDAKDYSSDYPPLTEAQKDEMTDEQIEDWNKKAKNGILRNDSTLESLITDLKNTFFSAAGGTGKSATSIGIAGASYFGKDKGMLSVDKDALTAALKENPDEVISIFTGGNTTSASADQGIVYKMRNLTLDYLDTADDSVETTEDNIDDIEDEVDKMQDKLDDMASRYYNKFSAMETALASLNSQASYISQLFSS